MENITIQLTKNQKNILLNALYKEQKMLNEIITRSYTIKPQSNDLKNLVKETKQDIFTTDEIISKIINLGGNYGNFNK